MSLKSQNDFNIMQGRNGDSDVNKHVDTVGEGESGINGESSINIYTLSCVKWTVGEKLLYNTITQGAQSGCSVMT